MPEDVSTQETTPFDPSSDNDRDSMKFTGSNNSTHRSDAPQGPTLGERVFAAYKQQENTDYLPVRIMGSWDNMESWMKFSGSYDKYEEELKTEKGGPISRYRQGVGSFRVWNAFRFVSDSDPKILTEDWCKYDHIVLRDCFKADA